MGRSAKLFKRPSQKQKAVSKMAREASKPVVKEVQVEEAAVVESKGGKKKRKTMRAKSDKKGKP